MREYRETSRVRKRKEKIGLKWFEQGYIETSRPGLLAEF